jgi:hypothetical protein
MLDLFANPLRTALRIDPLPLEDDQRAAVAGADAELEFRAADFDAEDHGWPLAGDLPAAVLRTAT